MSIIFLVSVLGCIVGACCALWYDSLLTWWFFAFCWGFVCSSCSAVGDTYCLLGVAFLGVFLIVIRCVASRIYTKH